MESKPKNGNDIEYKNTNDIININKDNNSNKLSNNNIIEEMRNFEEKNIKNHQEKSNFFFKNFIIDIKDKKNKSFRSSEMDYKEKDLLKEKDKKIEVLKEQCEALQKQLQMKTDYIIKEKEKATKIINNNISDASTFFNMNTSTNFPMKSEIKKTWEEFALVSILDNFIDYENRPELIFYFVTEMIVILNELINNICVDIYKKVSASLGIPNDKKLICDIEKTSRPLIKEHLNKIFISTEEKPFINKFINLYKNSLNLKFGKLKIEEIINSSDFFNMIKKIKDILLFAKFNDPPLAFDIEKNIMKRKCEYLFINNEINKKDYLIINDNGFQDINAIIILKCPVMKNGFPINNDLKTIIMIKENNYKDNIHHSIDVIKKENILFNNINNSINFRNENIKENKNHTNKTVLSNDYNSIKKKLNERSMTDVEFNNNIINMINIGIKHNNNKKISIERHKGYNVNKNLKIINIHKNKNAKNKNNKYQEHKESKKKICNSQKIKNNNNFLSDNDINSINNKQREKIVSNFSFMSENLNINNEMMENFEKSIDQKILFSESREELKSIASGRNLNILGDINNSFFNYKQNKYKKKTKKVDNLNKNNIKISVTRLNNVYYSKYSNNNHKKNSKDKILVFYNKQLPLLLKRSNNVVNRLKPNNLDKSKSKKISNNKINNKLESCSTEIYSKDSNNGYEKNCINYTNNDLLVKNKTVKELFDNNKKYNNVIKIITNRPKKINMLKQNLLREMKDNKSGMKQKNKKTDYLKSNSISKNKQSKKKEISKSKLKNNNNSNTNINNNIKIILRYILNENLKYDCNKNMIILNRLSASKNKENTNKTTTHIQKNIKSISGKNILLSPTVTKENNKKTNFQRNNKNKANYILNNIDGKKKNNLNNLLKNTNTSFPNLRRSVKNDHNTGYKIKNLNINYFNIIQPNELFFNPKSSRSNSKRQKNNKNNFIIFNNNNNLNNSSNFIFESKVNNTLIQKNKIKYENKNLLKNSLYLITDYNYNTKKNNNTCQKIKTCNIHQHNISCSNSSFSPNKFGGTSIIYMSKDKNGKKLIKRKMYNKDISSFNYNNYELNKKSSNNNIIKNNNFKNYNMQISFIKIPKKINNIKRDISTGRKVSNNKNKYLKE